jgi:hypothetical protein
MTSSCKHGNEPVGSTTGRKFHDQLGDYLCPQELCFTKSMIIVGPLCSELTGFYCATHILAHLCNKILFNKYKFLYY